MRRPVFPWQAALAGLRADRTVPAPVREERLRSAAGLRGTPPVTLSAWRGKSGRRYVVRVRNIASVTADDFGLAVMIAIHRDPDGVAQIVRISATPGTGGNAFRLVEIWLDVVRRDGATEVHFHRLVETWADALVVLDDLGGLSSPAAPVQGSAPCS